MTVSTWTEADSNRAQELWLEYRQHQNVSINVGQTAGLDPVSGRFWIGDSIQDVIAQRDADGSTAPFFFMRVGSDTNYRKRRSSFPDYQSCRIKSPFEKGLQRQMRQMPL